MPKLLPLYFEAWSFYRCFEETPSQKNQSDFIDLTIKRIIWKY